MKPLPLALALSGLVLVAPAHAGPRESARGPAPKASLCPPGFAALQDSTTCVRISGRVRADALVASNRIRALDAVGTQTSGRVQLDVRTQTEYGPLRAVIRAEGVRR
ncbi:porin [Microvirga sp. GCM10011540]|uniref:porin n=1 Tax=Microvirga sp. GCM10011540 TaxID=3317338 RepID=UPI0036129FBE